ncbi:MAG: hypothetical protein WC829_04315, partial [Hyphomicrobium sp.]
MARKAKTAAEVAPATITAYKGLDSKLQCRGFQFEVGKTYECNGKIVVCQNGFHAVSEDNPLHVWGFYPVIGDDGSLNRYAEVVQSGAMDREKADGGTKIASASITIKAELTLPDFIKRAITSIMNAAKGGKETVSSGDFATLAASGDFATLAASGNSATLAASGDFAKLAASGNSATLAASSDSATLAASGNSATLAASGDFAKLAASGNSATLAASGDFAKLAASGDFATLAASGNSATLAASGKDSVIAT